MIDQNLVVIVDFLWKDWVVRIQDVSEISHATISYLSKPRYERLVKPKLILHHFRKFCNLFVSLLVIFLMIHKATSFCDFVIFVSVLASTDSCAYDMEPNYIILEAYLWNEYVTTKMADPGFHLLLLIACFDVITTLNNMLLISIMNTYFDNQTMHM